MLEAVADIQQKVTRLDGIERDVAELKQDGKVVKVPVEATNCDMADVRCDLSEHKWLTAQAAHRRA